MTELIAAEPVAAGVGTPEPQIVPAPPPRRRLRRTVRLVAWFTLATVLAVTAGAGLTATWLVRRSFPQREGTIAVPGVSAPVRVLRDGLGVPQIYASTPHDLFLAQGYVHAQDRFWEMDVRRHLTAGRLSELFGESQVEFDATIRTMGWRRVAEQEVALLNPESRAHLRAYADGVNAYLRDHRGWELSAEYGLLALTGPVRDPEPWTEADSVAWLKAMAWNLNGSLADQLRRSLLNASLPSARVDQLFPAYDFDRWPAIVADPAPSGGTGGGAGAREPSSEVAAGPGPDEHRALLGAATASSALDAVLGPRSRNIGSNSWVVAGSRTTTGKPLLANDPHLTPSQPGVWYQTGLHCETVSSACPYDVSGFGFAGMPGVVIGHNARVAWAFTNLGPADTDLYLEKITGDTYEYRGAQVPLATRTETIEVAGAPSRTITVRATRHGPVISDAHDRARLAGEAGRTSGVPARPGGYAVALRWTALEPRPTLDAVFGLNTARDWPSFRAAAAKFAAPAQNMLYADVDGHIGYQAPGLIPVRAKGAGTAPVPGWTGEYEWTGFVPFEDLPRSYDPAAGYLVTANNAAAGPTAPHQLTTNWNDGYRARRITDLIEGAGKLDAAAMTRIQSDTRNPSAEVVVPYLLAVSPGADARGAQDLLRGWDFGQPADSAPAAYFNAVWDRILELTIEPAFAGTPAGIRPDGGGQWYEIMRGMLARPDDPWWRNAADPRGLRTRDDVLRAALDDAAAELTGRLGDDPREWRWGDLHTLTLRNETLGTGGPAPVQWLLNRGPYPVGGGNAAVDATGWDAKFSYEVTWVPSMRMVVDLSDLDASRWVNLTGQSGHAFDDHYDDQQQLWRAGQTAPWPFHPPAVAAATRADLTLTPAA
ncbi:penicillin acylase family protein [Actinoplanes sp. NPDC051859]|uniref:penicillin acylase family protein n=1 Tax=Actinoplanes sp. NPDC051859 TaxID=3363909 RepID=UPI0037919376